MTPTSKPRKVAAQDPAVILTVEDMALLSARLRRNVMDKEQLLAAIAALNSLSIEGAEVVLEPRLLERLKSRCLDKPNFPKWLSEVIVKQLHDYVGW
jgi:hypothetical protein